MFLNLRRFIQSKVRASGENIHAVPRRWSNSELRKFSPMFSGSVINVSAWKDEDKEGKRYRDYFVNAASYTVSNHETEFRGAQHIENEIIIDLEKNLSPDISGRFDVVFNHTTLEHIYDFRTAFRNLCLITEDILVLVVPFIQQMHTTQGDFWRFSPEAIVRMHKEEGLEMLYLSFNNHVQSSVYIFSIASKRPERWASIRNRISYAENSPHESVTQPLAGCNAILPR